MRIESCHPGVIALYFAAMLAFTGWFAAGISGPVTGDGGCCDRVSVPGRAVEAAGLDCHSGRRGVPLGGCCSAALGTPCSGGSSGATR